MCMGVIGQEPPTKLLVPFTGTGSVFFPIGKPPVGTCEFATEACMEHCYVGDRVDFDEETRVSYSFTRCTLSAFLILPIEELVRRIIDDLEGLQTPIMSWFGSGDCRTRDTDRISSIIKAIPKTVVQMGFTRNVELWKRHKDIFALTVESEEAAHALGDDFDAMGLYSIPDYEGETSVMYCPSHEIRGGYCGPIVCQDRDRTRKDLTHYINCRTCLRRNLGCFDRRLS